MNAAPALMPLPARIEDTEAYDDLCELLVHGAIDADAFSRRLKELKHEHHEPSRSC